MTTLQAAVQRSLFLRSVRQEAGRNSALNARRRELLSLLEAGNSSHQVSQTAREYLRTVLAHASESLIDAVNMLEVITPAETDVPIRALVNHPDVIALRAAIHDAMTVLEATKSAFKSRELGDLRERLRRIFAATEPRKDSVQGNLRS